LKYTSVPVTRKRLGLLWDADVSALNMGFLPEFIPITGVEMTGEFEEDAGVAALSMGFLPSVEMTTGILFGIA